MATLAGSHVVTGCESACLYRHSAIGSSDVSLSSDSDNQSWHSLLEIEGVSDLGRMSPRPCWSVKKAVEAGKESNGSSSTSVNGMHRELMRLPNSHQTDRSNKYTGEDDDDFIASESDRQLLLIKQQDEDLDELGASLVRIGDVGLTIHDELLGQEKILDDLGMEMDSTSNRLDFVQKKVAMVMKKAGIKGQIMMILFLVVLFIVLFVLVFLT
nr:syntaxin-61 [Quercus suber]